jgi:hypothetical protein
MGFVPKVTVLVNSAPSLALYDSQISILIIRTTIWQYPSYYFPVSGDLIRRLLGKLG